MALIKSTSRTLQRQVDLTTAVCQERLLATLDAPAAQRLDQRLRHFHAALERHPAQLHETELGEYLAMKRREARRPADAVR